MTTVEWLAQCRRDAGAIKALIRAWHPINLTKPSKDRPGMRITAPNVENVLHAVRADIRRNTEGDPVSDFDAALQNGNTTKLSALMNDAWFGVPESTDCWRLEGFSEAVALLENDPDDEDES